MYTFFCKKKDPEHGAHINCMLSSTLALVDFKSDIEFLSTMPNVVIAQEFQGLGYAILYKENLLSNLSPWDKVKCIVYPTNGILPLVRP